MPLQGVLVFSLLRLTLIQYIALLSHSNKLPLFLPVYLSTLEEDQQYLFDLPKYCTSIKCSERWSVIRFNFYFQLTFPVTWLFVGSAITDGLRKRSRNLNNLVVWGSTFNWVRRQERAFVVCKKIAFRRCINIKSRFMRQSHFTALVFPMKERKFAPAKFQSPPLLALSLFFNWVWFASVVASHKRKHTPSRAVYILWTLKFPWP